MNKNFSVLILAVLAIFAGSLKAQVPPNSPSCPTQSIYAHNGNNVDGHSLPNGPLVNILNNLPPGSGGLAIGPAFGFPAPNPTWWTTAGGTYWYRNNLGGWTNTLHSTGNAAAVNIGGSANFIYNLVGATGQIYVYNGTGNGTLLNTLVPAFGGGGPYDIVCDMADNFYILRANNQQGVYCYNPQGVLTCSWSMTGMISQTAGGGFAILTTPTTNIHRVYYNSNGTDYIGNMIAGNSVIISTVQALPGGSDYACCALPVPIATVAAPNGGALTCGVSQIPLVAQVNGNNALNWTGGYGTPTTALISGTCGSITWSGPGIVSGQGTATIMVNQPGLYSYTLNGCSGCPNYTMTASFNVVGGGGIITPVITAPNCYTGPSTMSVSPNNPTNNVQWAGPGIVGPANVFTINFNQPGTYSVTISSGTACTGSASIVVNPTPTITAQSNPSIICFGQTATLTAGGAGAGGTYTWDPGSLPGVSITVSPNATTIYTVVGTSSAGCSSSATVQLDVDPTPTIIATPNPSAICFGESANVSLSGATSYTTNPGNLNGNNLVLSPSVTTVYTVAGSSAGGCTTTANFQIVVNPLPTITVNNPTICANVPLNLQANGANTYAWTGPMGFTSNQQNPSIPNAQPNMTGQYQVIGTTAAGCTASAVSDVSVIPVPQPNIFANTPCVGGTLNLMGSGGATYTWTGPAGFSSNLQGPSLPNVNLMNGGPYTLGVSVGICTSSAVYDVTINPLPTASLTSSSPVCEKESVTIAGVTGGLTYQWFGPNNYSAAGSTVTLNNMNTNQAGTYTAQITDGNGCVGFSMINIIVNPLPPVATIGSTVCANTTATIVANGGISYAWSGPGGFTANTSTVYIPNITLGQIGTYSVLVTSINNCTASGVVHVSVNPMPTVTAGYNGPICAGGNITLTAEAANTDLYYWQGPLNFLSVLQNPPLNGLSPAASGVYTVYVHDAIGCSGYGLVNVLVRPLPNITIISDRYEGCAPLCIKLNQQSSNQILATQWSFGNGSTAAGMTADYCFKDAGGYGVAATYTDAYGCTNTSTVAIHVWPVPQADFHVSPGAPVVNEEIEFRDASLYANVVNWSWHFNNNGTQVESGNPVIKIFENEGSYAVALIVTSDHGCIDTIVKPIIVGEGFGIYVPDAFTPNGDNVNDIFTAKGYGIKKFDMMIFDRWGEKVFTTSEVQNGWDGRFQGRGGDVLKQDVYVWKIKLVDSFGKAHEYTGKVTLLK